MNDPAPSVGVDDVIITGELTRRPSRTPDFEAESKALTSLVKELAERPGNVLQRLVEVIVEMGVAGSAGVSLLEGERFRWAAIAGEWAALVDEGMPVDASPCGIVVARDQMLLFEHPEQVFPGNQIDPLITETLLVPFHVGGKAVGTVWLLSHDARKFDAEDARLLQSLAEFASAAYQLNSAIAENQTYLSEERSAARRLQQVSKELLLSDEPQPLYDLILDAMTGIMRSQAASIQILDEKTGQLRLLGSRGLHPRSAEHWQIVDAQSASGCGEALRSGSRVIIADVEKHPPFAGDPALEEYRRCGLRSVQSTPLIARDGRCLGMISTLWAAPHTPSEDDFLRLDVLAREAADLIERRAFEGALRDGEEQLRLIVESARDYAIFTTDRNGIIDTWLAGAESVFGYPPDEALGQPADILFTPEDRERGAPQQELETARREDKSPDVRWHLHKDGHRVFIEGEVVCLRDGGPRRARIPQDRPRRDEKTPGRGSLAAERGALAPVRRRIVRHPVDAGAGDDALDLSDARIRRDLRPKPRGGACRGQFRQLGRTDPSGGPARRARQYRARAERGERALRIPHSTSGGRRRALAA
jgi:PAS domain S-box-containing protein